MLIFKLRTGLMSKWPYKIDTLLPMDSSISLLSRLNSKNLPQTISSKSIANYKQRTFLMKKFFDKQKVLYINSRITSTRQKDPLNTVYLARQFIDTLTSDERKVIKEQLEVIEQEEQSRTVTNGAQSKITFQQLALVSVASGLPFIGFGFVDNFLMIVAGDVIETYIGFYLPISTMAAAGLGNAMSDVAGIGLAHHIEYYCSKITQVPKLSPEDWNRPIVHWCHVIAKSFCIFIGCLIGMFPLLFKNHSKKQDKNE